MPQIFVSGQKTWIQLSGHQTFTTDTEPKMESPSTSMFTEKRGLRGTLLDSCVETVQELGSTRVLSGSELGEVAHKLDILKAVIYIAVDTVSLCYAWGVNNTLDIYSTKSFMLRICLPEPVVITRHETKQETAGLQQQIFQKQDAMPCFWFAAYQTGRLLLFSVLVIGIPTWSTKI